ncbi:MAG TPA: cyclic nucleotide-binding domain-containing protein [Spirochaetota bacterium]|jgi:CRP/FNR family transcriptional regulator|nr:cyclic nucleotide-binding domain-containing protein [Spirochaetota bacterium]OQA99856.1 MAG: cAMP-activated global transcriptional regulator CRP [Spirochaetes bacterium ADurb.Bin218]HOK01155.1 cyclic nucleotide-binding domain-containing protein [Spirochaetota bacterium]HOK92900.1 cyclic nucleotide-binding domain-containing protein [Spirochaetota bacterium]HON15848.1 cyclic nucleotide-binding domain-containing protein [Spirochaetota bacterium]
MTQNQFKIENYMANSFIMVEGKKNATNFYIIRSGKVKLYRENPVLSEEPFTILGPGDFFGVVSCMSGHAREDTAVALENVSLISVEKDLFGLLIQKNPVVAMKIIRFFSRKLRQFDSAITSLSLKKTSEEDPEHLFVIGEYYLKKRTFNHAIYAYQKYIEHNPTGIYRDKAIERLKTLKAPLKFPDMPYRKGMNRKYPDNTLLFCESEPGDELFIIQEGKVKITKIIDEEILLAVLKPGDIFGEMALLDNKPRSASAISYGDVTVLAINKSNFEGMVQAQPQLATRLIQLLSERTWTAYRQLDNLMIRNPLGRIYDTLLIQIEKQKIPVEPKKPHNFEFGSKELINMVGLSPVEGEALIVKLLEDKHIMLKEGKIITTDLAELEKTVQFYRKQTALERQREANKNK